MKVERQITSEDFRRFWEFVDRVADEVAKWPAWMKGGPLPSTDQKSEAEPANERQGATGSAL